MATKMSLAAMVAAKKSEVLEARARRIAESRAQGPEAVSAEELARDPRVQLQAELELGGSWLQSAATATRSAAERLVSASAELNRVPGLLRQARDAGLTKAEVQDGVRATWASIYEARKRLGEATGKAKAARRTVEPVLRDWAERFGEEPLPASFGKLLERLEAALASANEASMASSVALKGAAAGAAKARQLAETRRTAKATRQARKGKPAAEAATPAPTSLEGGKRVWSFGSDPGENAVNRLLASVGLEVKESYRHHTMKSD